MQATVGIRCLGHFAVDGLSSDIRGDKQTALMAYLACNLGSPCKRSTLASLFWGDRFDSNARQSLRQALTSLRRTFHTRADCLLIERDTVCLVPNRVSVDVLDAQAALANGNLEKAARLFRRGTFLEHLSSSAPAHAEWLEMERAKWRTLASQAILGHAQQLLDDGKPVAAEEMATWLLYRDPYDETAVRIAMQSRAASGSASAAVRLYRKFESELRDELGVAPAPETVACVQAVLAANGGRPADARPNVEENDPRPRVIVLPFVDTHAGRENSSMGDSLTEEVISALGRFRDLAVIGKNTAFAYRDVAIDLSALVRDLDVQYVVSGTVRRLDERLRITVELDDALSQRFVSSEKSDCKVSQFYDVQDDLACAIAGAIKPELVSDNSRKYTQRPIESLALWERALVAQAHLERGSEGSIQAAEALALEILEEDDNHLQAQKILAMIRYVMVWNLWPGNLMEMAASALELSERVLEMDPFDSDTLSIAARNHLTLRNYDKALELAEHSTQLNPSNAQSHIHLGACYSNLGRFDEAFVHFREARRLSPRDRLASFWDCAESYAHYGQGNHDNACHISSASAKKPGTWAWTRIILAASLVKLQRIDEAERQADQLLIDYPSLTCERIQPLLMPQFEYDLMDCLSSAGVPAS